MALPNANSKISAKWPSSPAIDPAVKAEIENKKKEARALRATAATLDREKRAFEKEAQALEDEVRMLAYREEVVADVAKPESESATLRDDIHAELGVYY